MAKIKEVSLDHLLENKLPIYVMNKTANPQGDVTITMWNPDGSPYIIKIPKTFIPVNITNMTTHKSIANSPDFRKVINKRLIVPVDNKWAEDFLKDPDAKAEEVRLNVSKFADVSSNVPEKSIDAFSFEVEKATNINIKVLEIVERDANEGESKQSSIAEIYSELRTMEDSLTEDDLRYIVFKTKHEKIKNWATRKLEELGKKV